MLLFGVWSCSDGVRTAVPCECDTDRLCTPRSVWFTRHAFLTVCECDCDGDTTQSHAHSTLSKPGRLALQVVVLYFLLGKLVD